MHILHCNNCMLSSSKYTSKFLRECMSPHLDCYSVRAADISIEDFTVGSTIAILTVLFSYPDGIKEIQQTKFQTAVSLQRPRGSMRFMQYSCSAQPELLKEMNILHAQEPISAAKWRQGG